MPLFTVVMPCFRAEATIGVAIASVLGQTETDLELIVVDDGSDDDSAAAAERALAGDARGRLLRQPNRGPGAARNLGAATGTGQLLAFLDADDRWVPQALAMHRAAFAADPGLGAGFARIRFYDAGLGVPGRISAHHREVTLVDAMGENPFGSTSNLVLRREAFAAVGGFDETLRHAEDQDMLVRLLAHTGWRAEGIDAPLVHYRMSAGGLSADIARMHQGWEAMVARLAASLPPGALATVLPQARARVHRYLARRALRTGQPARVALGHLFTAFRASPSALLNGERRRTALTVAGTLAALVLPRRLVAPLIAR